MYLEEHMNQWNTLATEESIQQTIASLGQNGIRTSVVQTKDEAKEMVRSVVPERSEVMTMTSVTLQDTGIAEMLDGNEYHSVRKSLNTMERATQGSEMNKLGAAPDWVVGSVHAVTEEGHVVIASNTGSQIPAYAYGSQHVVWVVGTQKIVKNLDEAMMRLEEYILPLESERVKKAYGIERSNISKLLIVKKEVVPERIHMILVQESLGF